MTRKTPVIECDEYVQRSKTRFSTRIIFNNHHLYICVLANAPQSAHFTPPHILSTTICTCIGLREDGTEHSSRSHWHANNVPSVSLELADCVQLIQLESLRRGSRPAMICQMRQSVIRCISSRQEHFVQNTAMFRVLWNSYNHSAFLR